MKPSAIPFPFHFGRYNSISIPLKWKNCPLIDFHLIEFPSTGSLKESLLMQEKESQVLSEQLQHITEQLKLKYRALIQCDDVIKDAEAEYEQFTHMYTKSQK